WRASRPTTGPSAPSPSWCATTGRCSTCCPSSACSPPWPPASWPSPPGASAGSWPAAAEARGGLGGGSGAGRDGGTVGSVEGPAPVGSAHRSVAGLLEAVVVAAQQLGVGGARAPTRVPWGAVVDLQCGGQRAAADQRHDTPPRRSSA